MGYGLEFYQSQTILMTGITALLTMIPCIWFYQKDKSARIVRGLIPEQPGKKLKPEKESFYFWWERHLPHLPICWWLCCKMF